MLGEYILTIPPDYTKDHHHTKYNNDFKNSEPFTGIDGTQTVRWYPDGMDIDSTIPQKTQKQRILDKLEKLLDILLEE